MAATYIEQYNQQIQTGKIAACQKIKALYKHLVHELRHPAKYHFDEKKANRPIEFIERFCRQSKGKEGGQPLTLMLWEKALTQAIYGFVDDKGLRQYREAVLIVARKNGKSTWGSGIANYMLFADGEAGPEIYAAATKREQAKIIWEESRRMIKKSPVLRKRSKCLVSDIKCLINDGVFKPLAGESHTEDGLNPHCAFLDEFHAWKDKNLYDVIVDGETARLQPLTIMTSSAGTVRENVFDLKYQECSDVINGYSDPNGVHDEHFLPVVYELDKREEWKKPKCWIKANPGLGTIKNTENLAAKVTRALQNPAYVKNLCCKDFNIRETSSESFLTFDELNNTASFDLAALQPRYAIGGFDLSQTVDLTSTTLLFKLADDDPMFYTQQMYWIPEDVLEKRMKDKVPYDLWIKQGFIRLSPGNRIDYHLVLQWFQDIQKDYGLYFYKIGYDRYSASYLVTDMIDFFGESTMDEVIQGPKTLSIPMQLLKAELQKKHINYGNNPVTKWCMANARCQEDVHGNLRPFKDRNKKLRDDGFMSLLDAYTSYQRNMEDYHNLL